MKFTKKTIYIGLFSILYLIVAFSSFFHAVSFFGLANNSWMSIILAFAFEVGQAAVLFSLLTSVKDRSRVMPWVLMIMFTLVQVIGNVYSSYKYIIMNSVDNLRFFKEPIFIWTELPDAQANVIIVYLVGAILPIAALFLTSMITNYLTDQEALQKEQEELEIGEEVEDETEDEKELENNDLNVELEKKDEEIEKLKKDLENERSLYGDIAEELPKATEELSKKDEEIEKLKKELEGLKQSKENTNETEKDEETLRDDGSNDSLQQENKDVEQSDSVKSENGDEDSIEHIEEPNGQESDTGESEPGVDDTISEGTGVEETTEELAEEPVEEDIQKRESHFINL